MANVRTLRDTKSTESKKIQGEGYRLGSIREQELEVALHNSIKSNSEITSEYKNMQVVYSNRTKNINKENAQLRQNNKELSNHIYRLIDEMKDFLSKIEALKTKLSSAQKDLSMKESEITPLRTELSALNSNLVSKNSELAHMENVLASKDDELKQMKDDLALKTSEIHSLEIRLSAEPVKIGGEMDEKKISNSVSRSEDAFASDIFAVNKPITIKNLSKYLRKKNMDQIEEIDIPQSSDTVNKANDETKPQILDSSRSINMKSSTSNADISQIVETKDFSEEVISKTDFIGNDQSYATKTKMAEILPIGALGVCETLVNDKYRIPPIVKLVILIIIAILIIRFVHKLIIWNKEKSTKSKSENGSGIRLNT
ncbi:9524_t:CDS:2 [Entrophospora sp. SA101]|nr:9524_t:CDS:2 [Entrophospora sp. SA101]